MTVAGCKHSKAGATRKSSQNLAAAREGFVTKLIKHESEDEPPEVPPEKIFQLIRYASPVGNLAAYVSPDPGDGKKHPVVIWLTGGFSNSISGIAWEGSPPMENDQSATAYRKAGIPMMYPSLRGGNDNPGFKEGHYGEVDDVLAAADHLAGLPWVDPSRIYLGGHSTGGTLALLTAEAAPEGRFRAVISFGPVEEVAAYGQDILPFDVMDKKEGRLRAPLDFLGGITCPTFVMEGEKGNISSLVALQERGRNQKIAFLTAAKQNHFSILEPTNALLAAKILDDTGKECALHVTESEIQAACAKARETSFHPPGDLRAKGASMGVVFYYTPEPSVPPAQALKEAVSSRMKGVPVVTSFDDAPKPPFIVLLEEQAPLRDYPVPDDDYFKHSARGIETGDMKGVQATKLATIVVLVAPADGIFKWVRAFNEVALAYAERTKAFIWDSATRECFHRDAWRKKRIEQWGNGELPDLRSQITIHAYKRGDDSGQLRAITLGMEKFALPDVAIEHLVSSDNNSAASLINVFCQTIAISPLVEDPANFPLSLDALEPASARDAYRGDVFENGSGKAVLAIMSGTPDDGDPENPQVTLDFRHGDGSSDDERRASLLGRFWGFKESVVGVRHDAEIAAASKEAKQKLSGLKEIFKAGLPPGSRLMVKAPFPRDDEGNEWMWIEVLRWEDGDVLSGVLQNEPFYIKALKQGTKTSVKAGEIFDYILYHSDGTMEGNKTGVLMEKQESRAIEKCAEAAFDVGATKKDAAIESIRQIFAPLLPASARLSQLHSQFRHLSSSMLHDESKWPFLP